MIATHTFNPSVDITYQINPLVVGEVHRVQRKIENPGGKGINVTKVLHQLGATHCALGYIGGANGQWIEETLTAMGITSAFTRIEGQTRQSIALNDGQSQTEILEQGPTILADEQQTYFDTMIEQTAGAKVMTISGSSPQFEGHSKFDHMARILRATEQTYHIVDTHAGELKALLQAQLPIHCIKPNQSEFEMLVDETDLTIEDIARILQTHAMFEHCDVFLTLGGDGALVKWQQQLYRATIPHQDIVNPVGSGDSTVAGIAYGVEQALEPEALIRLALACGTSNALQEQTGCIDVDQVAELQKEMRVERYTW
ncbi:1-phosphofructokinase family hexose kinase [Staphylococcus lutrae]|uniref:Tagatose-6-phosphate kinase n=1 Tax=Staphylococcus lutrae TaxID=155085 RepID=A0AAC9RNM5_9STAP|nr:hexose kinase [Staphylococcus lutrae]ARJ50813.1 tagatose-6-phosphate kinase [Staphylococcus lutrae]PNZ39773.1 tagatose-6-phosphate kinase [Staphylococcus lutrae]